jgi:hypothetical protein
MSLVNILGDGIHLGIGTIGVGELDLEDVEEWVLFGELEVEGGIIGGGEW